MFNDIHDKVIESMETYSFPIENKFEEIVIYIVDYIFKAFMYYPIQSMTIFVAVLLFTVAIIYEFTIYFEKIIK